MRFQSEAAQPSRGRGTQNPLALAITQTKVITANFTSRPLLRVDRPGLEGFTPAGFRLTLVSDPLSAYEILSSTNFSAWQSVGRVTNHFGEVQITDPSAANSNSRYYRAVP